MVEHWSPKPGARVQAPFFPFVSNIMESLFGYIVKVLILVSVMQVIIAESVMWALVALVGAYLLSVMLLLSLGSVYSAIIILLVYVGALILLFVFVVMWTMPRIAAARNILVRYFNYVIAAFLVFIVSLGHIHLVEYKQRPLVKAELLYNLNQHLVHGVDHGDALLYKLGFFLYHEYYILVIYTAVLLFITTVGVILICLQHYAAEVQKPWVHKDMQM